MGLFLLGMPEHNWKDRGLEDGDLLASSTAQHPSCKRTVIDLAEGNSFAN